jgi:hypothetical protein
MSGDMGLVGVCGFACGFAIDICDKELDDMITAIDTGKSSEQIVVETLECIDAIEAHREFTE